MRGLGISIYQPRRRTSAILLLFGRHLLVSRLIPVGKPTNQPPLLQSDGFF
nr:MAG TPA: hypothetical protein [Caudoviricetes sp.]